MLEEDIVQRSRKTKSALMWSSELEQEFEFNLILGETLALLSGEGPNVQSGLEYRQK